MCNRDEVAYTPHGYTSDLPEAEWCLVEGLLPKPKVRGQPRVWPVRCLVDAILYVLVTGCQWRNLPAGFPPRSTVYDQFAKWRDDGTWQRVHDTLRERCRMALGKAVEPTAAIIDSQTVKVTEKGAVGALTGTRGSSGASAISRWIPTASCCCRMCTRRTGRTETLPMPCSPT